MVIKIGFLIAAYLVGSIPFSVVIGRLFKGVDVRKHGSGNPGGTNALRHLGKKVGLLIIFFDIMKGGWVILLVQLNVVDETTLFPVLLYGVAAAVGHVYSIFLGFKGGKAVATSAGMIIFYNPLMAVGLAVVFFIVLKTTKYVSLASSSAAIGLVIGGLIFDMELVPYALFLCALVLYRHKTNFKNLRDHKEPKITWI